MEFRDCLRECLQSREFLAEFDRLTGCNLSLQGSALDLEIDRATGRLEHDLACFSRFVFEHVWSTLPGASSQSGAAPANGL